MNILLLVSLCFFLSVFFLSWFLGLLLSLSLRNYGKVESFDFRDSSFMKRNFGKICADFKFTIRLLFDNLDGIDSTFRYQFIALSVCLKSMVISLLILLPVLFFIFKNH